MGNEYFADKIVVTDGMAFGTTPIRIAEAEGDGARVDRSKGL